MTTFISRDSKYRGMQFDGENREKMMKLLGVEKQHCQMWRNEDTKVCHLMVSAPTCDLGRIDTKDWVLVSEDRSRYIVLTEERLKEEYEELRA